MANVAIIARPVTEGTRHALVLMSRITLPDGLLIGEFAVLPSSASRVL